MGKAPGSVVFIGKKKMEQSRFRLIQYNQDRCNEVESDNLKQLLKAFDPECVNWLNIDGVHDLQAIELVAQHVGLSPLQTESIANTDQRPRMLDHNKVMAIFLKMLRFDPEHVKVSTDQITFILDGHFLITFQENVGSLFDPIRERIRTSSGKLRSSGPDYLAYRIMDSIADQYLLCLSELGDLVEQNEVHILSKSNPTLVEQLYRYKTELNYIRKAVWPVKEITKQLKTNDSDLIHPETKAYLNALDDLIAHAVETIDVYHTMISDQHNIYNTNMNNRTNDVMKVLTIFASIFIPLTFIVGVYGTNFDYLPELHFRYGYLGMWVVNLLVVAAMLYFFRKKRWL